MLLNEDQVREITLEFAMHLQPSFEQYHFDNQSHLNPSNDGRMPTILSKGVCRQASAFGYKNLVDLGLDDVKLYEGKMVSLLPVFNSDLTANELMLYGIQMDEHGKAWHDHYWLEHNGYVIDLTKDQFGYDLTKVSQSGDPEYRDGKLKVPSYWKKVATTVAKFEGHPQTLPQEHSPHYPRARKSYDRMMEKAREIVLEPSLISNFK